MRFTNNPYEGFMKEKSYFKGVPPSLPPKGSRCDGCPYWRGIATMESMRRFQSCLIRSALLEWVGSARMTIWPWKS